MSHEMIVKFIENPPESALQKLQEILDKENPRVLSDIWVCINPFYIVAESGGSVVGVVSISFLGDVAEIHKIYVAPSFRKRGFARMLFGEAIKCFRQRRVTEIFFEAASEAGLSLLRSATNGMKVECICSNNHRFFLD